MALEPVIPETITVHLGAPDSPAENVTVSFPDYIKNVASSEIYPGWPEAALRANIYAQISFALNRVYTEWYPSRGYDFDITNSTAFDQSFVYGRDYYDSISRIVDEIFNSYIQREGRIEPLFAAYCDGVQVKCNGLEQVGTVALAEQGFSPLDILKYYYGSDIRIVENVPVENIGKSYPGTALRLGDVGSDVELIQLRLNRIARNYPAIPTIYPVNIEFGKSTENAVRAFQEVFGLVPDGVVGQATWYRIAYIFVSVKRLAELESEGLSQSEVPPPVPSFLRLGDSGIDVRRFQYYLSVIGEFYQTVQPIKITGVYDEQTESAVRDFQLQAGLKVDGITGINTWRAIYQAYRGILEYTSYSTTGAPLYPGEAIALGARGSSVRVLQELINAAATIVPSIPKLTVDGIYGPRTQAAVAEVQRLYGLNPNGVTGPLTWTAIIELASAASS